MSKPKTNRDGYALVMSRIAAPELGRLLGITRQGVHRWGGVVPERFVLRVSVITGIPPETILPETVREMQRVVAQRG